MKSEEKLTSATLFFYSIFFKDVLKNVTSVMLTTSHSPSCQIYFSSRHPSPGARTPVHTCNTSTSEAQPGDTVSFFCGDRRPSPVASESSSRNRSLQKASTTDLAQGQKHFFASLNKLFKFSVSGFAA